MATAAQIRQAVDDRLATLWTAIQNKEAAYMAAHNGRAWQGLVTHAVYPADGTTVLPTIGATCPTDQQGQPWPNAILTTPIEMAIQIDCYDGPQGTGYQATVYVTINGNTWARAAQVGPESWRQQGWQQL
jgi:hypothetical protein